MSGLFLTYLTLSDLSAARSSRSGWCGINYSQEKPVYKTLEIFIKIVIGNILFAFLGY